jgi:lipopolysaccharide/colanic/teichoic acid biosynthesis glycosyltransferase
MARPVAGHSRALGVELDLARTKANSAANSAGAEVALSQPPAAPGGRPLRRAWRPVVVFGDAFSLEVSFAIGALARQPFGFQEGPPFGLSMQHELPYLPFYIIAMAAYGLYQRDRRRLRPTSFMDIGPRWHALALGAVLTLAISATLHRLIGSPKFGWVEVLFMTMPATFVLPLVRAIISVGLRQRSTLRSRVVIVGSGLVATSLAQRLGRCADIDLLGFVDDEPHLAPGPVLHARLGAIHDLPKLCTEMGVDRVLVAFSQSSPTQVVEMLRQLPGQVRISVVPRLFELVTWQSQIEELHGLPVMAVIAIGIMATSGRPVFFRQDRVGFKGKTFRMIKFRTMTVGADEVKIDLREHNDVDGPLFKLHNDPRVTRIGRFLRSTSLDETPQLLNVLLGKMSLVGPRPFVPDESAGLDGWAAKRFDVRPGMTGLWQISGRNDLPFEELRQLDYAYVASWSLWWDLKILWHTPGSVTRRHGAY